MDMFLNRHFGFSGVSPFFPAPGPFHASLRNTDECRTGFPPIGSHAAMLYVIDNEQARTIRSFAPGGARAGFQYVNEVSGSIEPYRAMPLLEISNTLNGNGLATSAPKLWGNSCGFLIDILQHFVYAFTINKVCLGLIAVVYRCENRGTSR
jgi:hypothetical protein